MVTAPAAMPSEEEIGRALMKSFYDQWFAPGKPAWSGGVYWDFVNGSSAWEPQARAILALFEKRFAPILAEKERWKLRHNIAVQMVADTEERAEAAEARALSAEAALAAERERCLAIVEAQVPEWVKQRSGPYWDGYREAMEDAADDIRKGAAAIRAQGE